MGSLVTSLLTAPLAALIGWPLALLTWSVLTIAGIVLWGVHLRRARRAGDAVRRPVLGRRRRAERRRRAADLDPTTLTGPLPVVARGGPSAR